MSVNRIILVGNCGKDPEVSYTQSGTAVAKFSIATSEKWTDKATGEKKEKTDWHNITAFGKLGEICGEYLAKGKQVYIEGRIQYGKYEKEGITRYTADIIASQMQMLGSKANDRTTGQANFEQSNPSEPSDDGDVPF